jgi:hypothetical protein
MRWKRIIQSYNKMELNKTNKKKKAFTIQIFASVPFLAFIIILHQTLICWGFKVNTALNGQMFYLDKYYAFKFKAIGESLLKI